MSSDEKKIKEETKSVFDNIYSYFYKIYDYLIKKGNIFYFVIFIYFLLNNYYFENGKNESGGLLNILGIIMLIIFYLSFANFIRVSFKQMVESFQEPGETYSDVYKKGEFILLFLVTICTFIFGVFLMPNILSSSGIITKGFMRVWNPFYFGNSSKNISISEQPIYGYDSDNLYWGGEGFFEKSFFKLLSFPSVLTTAMFGFYQYLIPLFFGNGVKYLNPVDWGLIENLDENIRNIYEYNGFWRNTLFIFLLLNSTMNNLIFPSKGSINFISGLQIIFVTLSIAYIVLEGNEYMTHLGYTPSNQSGKPTTQDIQNTMTTYFNTKVPGLFLPTEKPGATNISTNIATNIASEKPGSSNIATNI